MLVSSMVGMMVQQNRTNAPVTPPELAASGVATASAANLESLTVSEKKNLSDQVKKEVENVAWKHETVVL